MSGTLTLTCAVTKSIIHMSVTRAKTAIYYITVLQMDGVTPFDLTDTILYFHASNGSFVIDKDSGVSPVMGFEGPRFESLETVSNGIVIAEGTDGLATLTIDPEDTESLSDQGVFGMPCEFTLTGGSPAGTLELAKGNLKISPNVGTP